MTNTERKDKGGISFGWGAAISVVLTLLTGCCLLLLPVGNLLTRWSYDLPFATRAHVPVNNAAIVYLDEASHAELDQPMTAPWDRALHAKLIERLTAAGAKAIVFDILFTDPSHDPEADAEMAQAIRKSGRVILAGNYQERETTPGAIARWEELPFEPFRTNAVGWGNANLTVDPDYGIRRFFPALNNISGVETIPWLPAAVARFCGAAPEAVRPTAWDDRWLNYYGPPGSVPGISYFLALQPDGAPAGYFKDRIVFVGAQLSADFTGKGKDEFLTPYAFWGGGFAPGVEIHATGALNLLHGNWMNRMPLGIELGFILLIGIIAGVGLLRVQPIAAVGIAFLAAVVVAILAHFLAWRSHLWFGWLILWYELAVALVCSIVYTSLRLYVEKKLLEQSLAVHLSPALVKRVLNDPTLRRRGGTKQEVSLLFTDIENFSRLSETMHPDDLVNLLNRYFEAALQCIHEMDGTVMDLVGDAIFAIWNAPLEQPDHQERACRAALMLREKLARFEDAEHGFPLRTRAGLHTGVVCVGNIGSERRFDYAAVGENTNLGSRLEGLNKHFGTDVLATRDIQRAVAGMVTSRLIGFVQVKGFAKAVEVHEFLGPANLAESSKVWRDKFAEGLQLFRTRRLAEAEAAFRETIELRRQSEGTGSTLGSRPADDGPSLFYLNKIAELKMNPPPDDWIGEVSMKEK